MLEAIRLRSVILGTVSYFLFFFFHCQMKEGTWITILMKLLGSSKCFILVLFPFPDERRRCLSRILMKLCSSLKHAWGKFKNPCCNTRNCFSSVTDAWWGKFRIPFCNTWNNFIFLFPIARWKELNPQSLWKSLVHWSMNEANWRLHFVLLGTVSFLSSLFLRRMEDPIARWKKKGKLIHNSDENLLDIDKAWWSQIQVSRLWY